MKNRAIIQKLKHDIITLMYEKTELKICGLISNNTLHHVSTLLFTEQVLLDLYWNLKR